MDSCGVTDLENLRGILLGFWVLGLASCIHVGNFGWASEIQLDTAIISKNLNKIMDFNSSP